MNLILLSRQGNGLGIAVNDYKIIASALHFCKVKLHSADDRA